MRGERDRVGFVRLRAATVLAACALALLVASAAAEATAPDRGGIATESLGDYFFEAQFSTVEARSDGGLLARHQDQLATFLANGAPDPGAPPQKVSPYRRVYPLGGGRSLLVEGRELTRLNPDGSVDTGFGGGKVKVSFEVQAAAELNSGQVAIANATTGGTHTIFTSVSAALVNPDGSIGGATTVSPPSTTFGTSVAAIAPRGSGGAFVVGTNFILGLRADGSPDPGFGSSGFVTGLSQVVGGRTLPDGGLELVGSGSTSDLTLQRYTAAGAPDTGFAPNGLRTYDLGAAESAHAALWGPDGSVLVGGASAPRIYCPVTESCEETPLVAGFDAAGNLDPSFGDGGVVRLSSLTGAPGNGGSGGVLALTRRPDGSVVAAGGAAPKLTVGFLAALSPQGALLPGFGEGGIVRERRPVRADQKVVGFASLPNGKLLAAGTTDVGVDDAPALIRYSADGSLDRSFGDGDGWVKLADHYFATAFSVNAAGQAAVAVAGYPYNNVLLRDGAGAPVRSFGDEGVVRLPKLVRVAAMSLGEDGSMVMAGVLDRSGDGDPGVVVRLRADGSLDQSFGHRGRVFLHPRGPSFMHVDAMASGRGGRILVSGTAGGRYVLGRLRADGSTDASFGSRGWAVVGAGAGAAAALRRTGSRTYLAGVAREGDRYHLDLFGFDADGRLDRGFGRGGQRTAGIAKLAQPRSIFPTRRGVLVVLSKGARPLLSFGPDGAVRRPSLGAHTNRAENVRAVRSGGRLIIGWNALSEEQKRFVYYLGSRPLR